MSDELLERDVLALHLAPDRIGRLLAAGDLAPSSPPSLQRLGQLGDDAARRVAALLAQEARAGPWMRGARVRVAARAKARSSSSSFIRVHADALGERRIDVHRLARDAPALVAGSLMKCSVRMLCSRSASLTSSTRMSSDIASTSLRKFSACLVLVGLQFDARQLGDAVDQPGDLGAEQPLDLVERGDGVLDRVVQQAGDDRGACRASSRRGCRRPRPDGRNRDRPRRAAACRAPSWRRHRRGSSRSSSAFGIVGLDPLDQLELPDHAGARPGGAARRARPAGPRRRPARRRPADSVGGRPPSSDYRGCGRRAPPRWPPRVLGDSSSSSSWHVAGRLLGRRRPAGRSCSGRSGSGPAPPRPSGSGSGRHALQATGSGSCSDASRSIVSSAISRSATTGFLSLSRSTSAPRPAEMSRARWAASSTSSKRLGTCWTQSSTVTRAMGAKLRGSAEERVVSGLAELAATGKPPGGTGLQAAPAHGCRGGKWRQPAATKRGTVYRRQIDQPKVA